MLGEAIKVLIQVAKRVVKLLSSISLLADGHLIALWQNSWRSAPQWPPHSLPRRADET